jgi:hypothetical protein
VSRVRSHVLGRRKALEQEMSQAGVSDAKKVKKRQKLERGFIRYGAHAVELNIQTRHALESSSPCCSFSCVLPSRMRRLRLSPQAFNTVAVIGRGAFGEVSERVSSSCH